MTLCDVLGNRAGACQILASDIDTQVLEKATSGVYRQDELRSLSTQQMQRYFCEVRARIRAWCEFVLN